MPKGGAAKPKPGDANARATCERRRVEDQSRKDAVPRSPRSPRCADSWLGGRMRPGDGETQKDTRSKPIIKKASSETRGIKDELVQESQSNKAFTVIAPNPKRRQEIQRKAAAELAALEDLRLSRAMAHVSITPSAVGGCLTLEEVRKRQQQEMKVSKSKKQRKRYLMPLQ